MPTQLHQHRQAKTRDPTTSWVFLQALIDGDDVTVELYGTPVDYDVEVDPPRIGNPIPPPAPVRKVDLTLAKGQRERLSLAQPGYDVFTTRRFVRDGETINEQTFASYYQPQPEMWKVGPDSPTFRE